MFELTEKQIGLTGPVLSRTVESRDRFRDLFSNLADRVIALTAHANDN